MAALNSTVELMTDIGRPRGDMWEVALWEDALTVQGNEAYYTYQVFNQAIVVPETIDAIRALCRHRAQRDCIDREDRSRIGSGAELSRRSLMHEPTAHARDCCRRLGMSRLLVAVIAVVLIAGCGSTGKSQDKTAIEQRDLFEQKDKQADEAARQARIQQEQEELKRAVGRATAQTETKRHAGPPMPSSRW